LWRLFAGIGLIVAGWLGWTVVVMVGFVLYQLAGGLGVTEALGALSSFVAATSPGSVIFKLATLAGIWPATWAAARLLHGQSFGTLLSPEGRMRWGDFGLGLLVAAAFWAIGMVAGIAVAGLPERSDLALGAWALAFAPLAVVVFVQASGEELVFRGYILQQLAARWRSPLIWAALPASLFGLAHYANGAELGIGWEYVTVTLLFGLAAAALVWRTGSLAAAMGLHTGLNVFSLSSVGLEGVVDGTQLFLYDAAHAQTLLVVDGVSTLAILLFVLSPGCPFKAREMV